MREAFPLFAVFVLASSGAVLGCGSGGSSTANVGQGGGSPQILGGGGLVPTGPGVASCSDGTCACQPRTGSCSGGHAKICRDDGTGWTEFECDPVQGMRCDPNGCTGSCAPVDLGPSYIGCDYYPTITLNPVWSGFSFAVAVANASDSAAAITVTRGADLVASRTVAADAIEVIALPWVADLKGGDVDDCQRPPPPGVTRVVADGAYRLRSDTPVTVYQLNPLTYAIDPPPDGCPRQCTELGGPLLPCKSYSNDASLLLPANTLTGNYQGLAWPSQTNKAAFLAITAVEDDTHVVLSGRGPFMAGAGIDASGRGEVVLGAGDVLEVVSDYTDAAAAADPTGTEIRATRPVQVIGGHSCANIPSPTTGYCDHLEEGLFPIETLGSDYLVTWPAAPGGGSPHVVRIAAVFDSTHVTFEPPVAPDAVLGPDDPALELALQTDVRVRGDQPFLVAQYMQGSTSVPSQQGDPSMSLAIPSAQFRTSYRFVASTTYDANYVNVIAPVGASVRLDGAAVPSSEFSEIGASQYAVARHLLGAVDGHTIESTAAFGIVVYGYGQDTSYMYPGGLDLNLIAPPPVK